jgi:flagellin-like hook-associated protein FlgL
MSGTDKSFIQNQDPASPEGTGGWTGECSMALSIPPLPAVGAENTNRSLSGFSQSLEKLSTNLRQSGVGPRPATSEQFEERVKAAELSKSVRNANDAVAEARTADQSLKKVGELLSKARSLAFDAINEPGSSLRSEDQVEYSKLLRRIDEIASSVVFGGGPLLEGSPSFGPEGGLSKVDLSSFQGSIGSIQVIDRAISEVGDQRGLLGIFQVSKLSQIGNLLRTGVGGLVSSNSVVRDRTVAINLATSAASKLEQQPDSSLLGSGNAAGQILASLVGRL